MSPPLVLHPLVALAHGGTVRKLPAEEALEIEMARAPLDDALRQQLGLSADRMVEILTLWHQIALRGRQEGGVVHAVLLGRLAEWIGHQDGAASRPPLRGWAEIFGWPDAMAKPWEGAYLTGHSLGAAWRTLAPWHKTLKPRLATLVNARRSTAFDSLATDLRKECPPKLPIESLDLWVTAARRARWERRMAAHGQKSLLDTGRLEPWWHRTKRAPPQRLGAVRGWWAMVGGAAGWDPSGFSALMAGGRWPDGRPGTLWETLARALHNPPLPGIPWPILALPGYTTRARRRRPHSTDEARKILSHAGQTLRGDESPTDIWKDLLAEAPRLLSIEQALGWPQAGERSPTARLLAHQITRMSAPQAPETDAETTNAHLNSLTALWYADRQFVAPWRRDLGDRLLEHLSAPLGTHLLTLVAPEAGRRLAVHARWAESGDPQRVAAVVEALEHYKAKTLQGFPAAWPAAGRTPLWVLPPLLVHHGLRRLLPICVEEKRPDARDRVALKQAWKDCQMRWRTARVEWREVPAWEGYLTRLLPVAFLADYMDAPFTCS